jgi:hypothetical protein
MKIYSIEVETDQGRRVAQFSAPIDVDPLGGDMPPEFRSFPELIWGILRHVAHNGADLAARAPKVEA